jgi:hypothetical protein
MAIKKHLDPALKTIVRLFVPEKKIKREVWQDRYNVGEGSA